MWSILQGLVFQCSWVVVNDAVGLFRPIADAHFVFGLYTILTTKNQIFWQCVLHFCPRAPSLNSVIKKQNVILLFFRERIPSISRKRYKKSCRHCTKAWLSSRSFSASSLARWRPIIDLGGDHWLQWRWRRLELGRRLQRRRSQVCSGHWLSLFHIKQQQQHTDPNKNVTRGHEGRLSAGIARSIE